MRALTHFSLSWVLMVMLLTSADAAPRLYKWVDDQGNVHYSDKVPAQEARRQKDVLNDQGVTVDRIERAKSREQLESERRAAREQAEQQAYDRMLLHTFPSEQDIIRMRNTKIATIENNIRITQTTVENLDRRLTGLMRRAANIERAGKPVPGDIESELGQVRLQIGKTKRHIHERQVEQTAIRKEFEAHIQRYRQLRAAGLTPDAN